MQAHNLCAVKNWKKYAKEKFGDKWVDAAANIGSQLALDKNNSLTYTQVIECGEQTKEKLYVTLNHWFVESFNDAKLVIQLNDKMKKELLSAKVTFLILQDT